MKYFDTAIIPLGDWLYALHRAEHARSNREALSIFVRETPFGWTHVGFAIDVYLDILKGEYRQAALSGSLYAGFGLAGRAVGGLLGRAVGRYFEQGTVDVAISSYGRIVTRQSYSLGHGSKRLLELKGCVTPSLSTGTGIVSGLRNQGAFGGMTLTGFTGGGMPRVSIEWRALRGPSAMRRHHLVPQEMLKDPEFMARMRALGHTNEEINTFVNRQIADIPNVQHMIIHAEGWNPIWRIWLQRNPNFTISDIRAQIRSMIREFGLPSSSTGDVMYGR